MNKRRRQDSDDRFEQDNPIGLTSAFEVIRDPQAVEYAEGDEAIGLTEAFGAVSGEEDVVHSWDRAGKWTDFDWDASAANGYDAEDGGSSEVPATDEPGETPDEPSEAVDAVEQADAVVESIDAEASEQISENIAEQVDVIGADSDDSAAASSASVAATQVAASVPAAAAASAAATVSSGVQDASRTGGHGRHAAPIPELSPRMKQSKRLRKTLVLIIILLIAVVGVVVYFGYQAFDNSQHEAAQQAQEQTAAPKEDIASSGQGDADTAAKLTEVPALIGLFGKTTKAAVKEIGHGAIVTSNRKTKEKGSAIKKEVSVALTEEPADSKTGTPTVYLGLNKDGKIIQVGYSASASALGFGSFSFADAINEKRVVEETFKLLGVKIPEGAVKLPKDKKKYSTYGSDGTTVVKERYSFDGDVEVGGAPYTWSAVLSYDYTTQVLTGNLSDTVRVIYAYLTQK